MNGLGLPKEPPTIQQLRDEVAMADACLPIWRAHQDAKTAYREAVASGDLAAMRAAAQAKNDAAVRLNQTRQWLRRERRIAKLEARIPALEARLAGKVVDEHGRESAVLRAELQAELDGYQAELDGYQAELPALLAEAQPLRDLFGATAGGAPVVVVEDGDADAEGQPVRVRAKARTGKTGGN